MRAGAGLLLRRVQGSRGCVLRPNGWKSIDDRWTTMAAIVGWVCVYPLLLAIAMSAADPFFRFATCLVDCFGLCFFFFFFVNLFLFFFCKGPYSGLHVFIFFSLYPCLYPVIRLKTHEPKPGCPGLFYQP